MAETGQFLRCPKYFGILLGGMRWAVLPMVLVTSLVAACGGADFPSCLEGAEKQYVESLWQVRGNLSTEIEQSEDLLDQAYEKRELHQDQQWVESYINSLRDVIAAAQILAVLEPEERFATVDAEEEKATEKLMDSAEMQGHWLDTQNDEYLANSASLKLEAYEIWAANDSSIWAMCQ